jgi:hypothetical protein
MPRGDKSAYTGRQRRQAEHIEDSYRARGRSSRAAERIAYATVNKQDGGGKRSGAGRGKSSTASRGAQASSRRSAPTAHRSKQKSR